MLWLEEVTAGADWVEAEQFWIAYTSSIGCRLTNHTIGGEGLTGRKHTKESIERTAAAHRGHKESPEVRARMSAAWTPERKAAHAAARRGRPMSAEQRAKLSAAHKGKVLTEEHRRNIGNAFRGKKQTAEQRRKSGDGIRRSWTPERRAAQAERMRQMRASV